LQCFMIKKLVSLALSQIVGDADVKSSVDGWIYWRGNEFGARRGPEGSRPGGFGLDSEAHARELWRAERGG
jgi:hypothetical protein